MDQLTALDEHKNFLFGIFEKGNPKWVEEQLKKKKAKSKTKLTRQAANMATAASGQACEPVGNQGN